MAILQIPRLPAVASPSRISPLLRSSSEPAPSPYLTSPPPSSPTIATGALLSPLSLSPPSTTVSPFSSPSTPFFTPIEGVPRRASPPSKMAEVIPGFSLTNRWLLYTSLMLTPAQGLSGVGSNCPSNIGFLAYNWYNQYVWYNAVKTKQLHALSLLPVHLNFIYALTYLGGVTSGNIFMGVILCLGTIGLMILNTVSAWMSWATNLPEGYGVYQFFFFGWRVLTPGWRTFFLLWQIGDSILVLSCIFPAIAIALTSLDEEANDEVSWYRYPAIILGPPVVLFATWPLILWTELIVSRNHIVSQTDMVAVYLFIAQVVTMLLPGCGTMYSGARSAKRRARDIIPLSERKSPASSNSSAA